MAKKGARGQGADDLAKVGDQVREFRLDHATKKPIQVQHRAEPMKYVRRERIHPRRVLPRVREGKPRVFPSLSRPLSFHLQAAGVALRATADDLTLSANTELSGPGAKQMASTVGEPSVCAAGQVVMYTGNWYAARSADAGQTFQFIDPFSSFPDPPNLSFCCDQVVNYIQAIDTFVWLLQYGPNSGPQQDNIQRLAFAKSADVAAGNWSLFDITTPGLGVKGQFMDFPDLAVGSNFLYVTTNLFTPDGQLAGAAVVRIPIANIGTPNVAAQAYLSPDPRFNSFRVAQNCGTTAFFAAHGDTSTLRVFSWEETENAPTSQDIGIAPWVGGQGYQSLTPDGRRWLDRTDPRLTGATMAKNELWFAWSVDGGSGGLPNPFVQVAHIDADNLTLLENVNVFDQNSATAYGALSTNSDNEVGISYMIGGANKFPSLMVGVLTNSRRDLQVAAGDRGTADGQWGDFLTVRPLFPDKKLFAATGYTMNGAGDGSNRDAAPRYVVFGRSGVGAVLDGSSSPQTKTRRPKPPEPAGPLPPTPGADGAPITDVNALSVVSAVVAAKIKAAAGLGAAPQASELAAAAPAPEADKPGTERWPVKTGQDQDRAKVGKNIINGQNLGAGIVESTIAELSSLPRPPGLQVATQNPPEFQSVRDGVTEVTIWRIDAVIIALTHESDGDYHLGPGGETMVGEVPTPTQVFVGDSPWLANLQQARQEIDQKLVKSLSPQSFTLVNDQYLPHGAVSGTTVVRETADPELRFDTPPAGSLRVQPLFATRIAPTPARLTGVGFFDRAHGATGAAPNVIELHPVLKVEWT